MNWQDKAIEIIDAACPELAGQPKYVNLTNELPAMWRLTGYAAGWTAAWQADALRPTLEAAGRWRGPGFSCIIDPEKLPARPWNLISVVLHELAHHVVCLAINKCFGVNELPVCTAALLASCAEPIEPPPAISPWAMHDGPFIRAAIHLRHRADKACYWLSLEEMNIAGDRYGLGSPWIYYELLADELDQRIHEPITTILQSAPPEAFTMQIAKDKAQHTAGTNHPESSGHLCNSCPAWRQQSGRPNFTKVYARSSTRELVQCEVCGRTWGVEI